MKRMRKYTEAGAGTVQRSLRDVILPTSRDIWRPRIQRFLNESKVSSSIIIPFKSAKTMHIDMWLLLLATKKALREKIVGSQRIETRSPLAELLVRGEAEAAGEVEAAGERSSDLDLVVQETNSGTLQSGTATGTDGVSSSRKRKVGLINSLSAIHKQTKVICFIKSKVVNPDTSVKC